MFGLEFLRFVLAFAVVVFHFGYHGPGVVDLTLAQTHLGSWAFAGKFGVTVFVLLSGYVITLSLAGRGWSGFILARLRRLMPAMIACATLTTTIVHLFEANPTDSYGLLWLKSVLLLPMAFGGDSLDHSYWSIAYELRFYALVALLLLLRLVRHLSAVLLVMSGAGIVLAFGFVLINGLSDFGVPTTAL